MSHRNPTSSEFRRVVVEGQTSGQRSCRKTLFSRRQRAILFTFTRGIGFGRRNVGSGSALDGGPESRLWVQWLTVLSGQICLADPVVRCHTNICSTSRQTETGRRHEPLSVLPSIRQANAEVGNHSMMTQFSRSAGSSHGCAPWVKEVSRSGIQARRA
jgi:hypothetical protein